LALAKASSKPNDVAFHEQLKSFFLAPEEVTKYLSEADQTISDKQEVLDSIRQERQRLGLAMDRIYELYIGGQIAADGFGTRYKPLEERAKQLDDEIPRLQGEIDVFKINYLSQDQVVCNARDLYAQWPQLDYEEKRKITESLTHKITIGKGEIDIDLCYLPASPQNVANEQRTH
jgi:hypothetical protein